MVGNRRKKVDGEQKEMIEVKERNKKTGDWGKRKKNVVACGKGKKKMEQ